MAVIDDIRDLIVKTERFYDKTKKLERVLLGEQFNLGDGSTEIINLSEEKKTAFKNGIKTRWTDMKDALLKLNFQ